MAAPAETREKSCRAARLTRIAAEPAVRECLQWFTRERQWINEQHLELARIPAPTFQEQKRAEWMAAQLRAIGCDSKLDRAGNVIAFPSGDAGGPLVAVTAHLDTVLSPRLSADVSVGPGGRFHGPGVSDNGAGLAALLAIAGALKAVPPIDGFRASLALAANVGEEGDGNLSVMRYLCRQSPLARRIAAFVVLDGPNTDHITCQALASRRFEISFTGPGGHSWSDFGSANPVHALGRAIALFTETRLNGRPRSSYNFGTIDGGTSVNSIPTEARAKLDIRSEDPRRIDELAAVLTASVEKALEIENAQSTGAKVVAKIREVGSRPGGSLPESAPIVSCVKAVDQYLAIRSRLDCASTDANVPLSLGVPAVSIGAGGQGGGAHSPSEWFDPEGRDLGLKRILLTLCLLLGDEAGKR